MSSLCMPHAAAMCLLPPQRTHNSRNFGGTARRDGDCFILPQPPPLDFLGGCRAARESHSWSLSFLRAFFWAIPSLYLVIARFISGSKGFSRRSHSVGMPSSTTPVWHLNMIRSSPPSS